MDCINPEHQSIAAPPEVCAGCAQERERELVALNDRYMRLLHDQRAHQLRTEAAAARTAHGHMITWVQLYYLGPAFKGQTWPIEDTLGGLAMIDPEIGRTQAARRRLSELKVRAEQARKRFWELEAGAEDAWRADPREAEILRLRTVIEAHGQALHKQHGQPFDGFTACGCPGCELIRAMDTGTLDLEVPDDAGSPAR
jgi:hypothetical protein